MNIRLFILLATGVLAAAGCTRHISRDISTEGTPGEVVFPDAEKARPSGGTHPSLEALRTVRPGVNKDTLYVLLGAPHHREAQGAREWDYLFNLPRGDGSMMRCQYKVIFDKEKHGQSFYWSPAGCADLLKGKEPARGKEPASVAPAPQPMRFDLSGDALFTFGGSSINDMLPSGREQLEAVAQQLRNASSTRVTVVGHTDFIGSEASNQALSRRRAEAVRHYLAARGVSGSLSAEGRGESEPAKACDEGMPRASLIACLQPNRRVEITGWIEK